MIDALYARYSRLREKPLNPSYKSSDAIRGKKLLNENSTKLAVIFPGWHSHNFPINILARRLQKHGWTVLVYDFHDQILEPNEDIVTKSFRYIRDSISAELKEIVQTKNYKQVQLIGISLGNVPLTLTADRFPNFTGATIVVGGDDLAVDMWYGLRTLDYRKAFEKMHVSIRKLDNEWQDVAPINHVKNFANKRVKIVISLHDKFVGTQYQKKLAQKIIETGAITRVKRSHFGHTLSIITFCLFGSPT